MKTLPYRQAFERIRAELLEMPGMHLTPEQVERLCGVERAICKAVLDDLVRAGFLRISATGSYCRWSDASTAGTDHTVRNLAAGRLAAGERRAC